MLGDFDCRVYLDLWSSSENIGKISVSDVHLSPISKAYLSSSPVDVPTVIYTYIHTFVHS